MVSLRKKTLHAVGWRTIVDIGEQILLIAFTAVLARLLTKADFGLIAMALLFNRFVATVTQIGFNTAIIQSPEITEAQLSAIFFIQVAIGFSTSLICHLLSPVAANFFHEPQLVPVIKTLSWVIFVNSLAFPQVFLQKKIQFRGFSLLDLGAMLVSNTVGIVMAFGGFGIWSLVCRLLLQRGLFVIGIWPLVRWRPVRPSIAGINKIFHFGLNTYGSGVFYYFSQNFAAIITGKLIGAETLGSFNIAYNLAMVPAQKVRDILTSALYPSFCAINQNIQKFKTSFYESLFTLGIIFIPAMLGLAVVADNLVVFIYGSKWKEAGLFLSFLAIIGLLKGIEHVLRSAILAKGWAKMIFFVTIIETAVSLPMMYYGIGAWGVMGLLYAYLCASVVAFAFSGWFAQRATQDNTVLFRSMGRSFIAAMLMVAIVFMIKQVHLSHIFAYLILQIASGAIAYLVLRICFLSKDDKVIMSSYPFWNYFIPVKKN
jgi:lipopolysaccharide exporter